VIFRNATQTGLNELLVTLLESADLYRLLAEKAGEPELRDLFSELALRRYEAANRVEEFVRRAGGLPDVPDRDRETLEQLLAEAQGAVAPKRRVQLHHALQHEMRLVRAVADTRTLSLEDAVQQFLGELERETRVNLGQLEQLGA